MKGRASVHTIGCRVNQAETALLADRLRLDGFELVSFGAPTDLLVLNTCSVTDNAEADCRAIIRRTLRHSPRAFVAVTGCYAQRGSTALQSVPGIDLIVGTEYKMELPSLLPAVMQKRREPGVFHSRRIGHGVFVLPGTGEYETARATLKIQDGCNFMCSFCVIPFTRGRERSRVFDDAVREAEALASRGHREIVLSGVNIGHYAPDGVGLLDLILRLEAIPAVARIRISSIEPTTIPDELLAHMARSTKLCRYLHVPLQSGDDRVLAAMNRRYTVADYRKLVDKALTAVPDLGLGTDLLVGFPGETEREFANTYAMVEQTPFDYCHVFSFSARPGTPASRMPGKVSDRTKKVRRVRLTELSRTKQLASARRRIGETVSTLFEHRDDSGCWVGHTEQFLRVAVAAPDDLRHRILDVRVTGATEGLALGRLVGQPESSSSPHAVRTVLAGKALPMLPSPAFTVLLGMLMAFSMSG